MKASLVAAVAAVIGGASAANAALIPNAISGVVGIGSAVGDGADPNPGSHSNVVNGNGVTVNNPLDSSTWRHSNAWQDGWQHKGAQAGSFILDLGSVRTNLDDLYIWNVTESGATNRGAKDIEVYYATSPTVTPVKNVVNDFASGGWTLVAATTLPQASGNNADAFSGLVDLSTVPSARYVGIRMINNYGGGDVGLAEAEVTVAVPEPATLGLAGVAGVGLLARRRGRRP
jgi:hypothetical protein